MTWASINCRISSTNVNTNGAKPASFREDFGVIMVSIEGSEDDICLKCYGCNILS
ncbi:hypothetical protein PA905_49650 [Planktothrix agardhii CCAP 1459/11A]|uniref:Uncharacterized protein n=1 Tax=Planktothrix agardhii CCAP 1459/11A TaxID=282420 RepID=A0A4P5ZM39_PLAAG|nr:hypothetical protein PA905_49650 [Planktothrix agardhii CCAP 1459/11A]